MHVVEVPKLGGLSEAGGYSQHRTFVVVVDCKFHVSVFVIYIDIIHLVSGKNADVLECLPLDSNVGVDNLAAEILVRTKIQFDGQPVRARVLIFVA